MYSVVLAHDGFVLRVLGCRGVNRHLIIEPIIFREPCTVRIVERSLTCDLNFAEQWSP